MSMCQSFETFKGLKSNCGCQLVSLHSSFPYGGTADNLIVFNFLQSAQRISMFFLDCPSPHLRLLFGMVTFSHYPPDLLNREQTQERNL